MYKMIQNSIKACLAAATACGLLAANAADCKWVGGATGDWNAEPNWKDGAKPTTTDYAVFSGTDQQQVTISSDSSPISVGGIRLNTANETSPITVSFDLGKDGSLTTSSTVNTDGSSRSGTFKAKSHFEFLSGLFNLGFTPGTGGHRFTVHSLDTDDERSSYLISGANTMVSNFALYFSGKGGRLTAENGATLKNGAMGPWANSNNKTSTDHQYLFTGAETRLDNVSVSTKTGDGSYNNSRILVKVADGAVATNMSFTVGNGVGSSLEVVGPGSLYRGAITYWGKDEALVVRDGGRLEITSSNGSSCPTNLQLTVSGPGSQLVRTKTDAVKVFGEDAFCHYDNTDGCTFPCDLTFNNPDTRFSGGTFDNSSWKAFTCGSSWSDARLAVTNGANFYIRQSFVVGAGKGSSRNQALIGGEGTSFRMWNNMQVGGASLAGDWSETCDNEVRVTDHANLYVISQVSEAQFPTIPSNNDRVWIRIGSGRGSCRNRVVIDDHAVVTNAGMIAVGGGVTSAVAIDGQADYTNGGGSLNALVVSNAMYVGKGVAYVNGTTVTGLAPEAIRADEGSYSNRIDVLDGAYASLAELRLSHFGTKSETTPDALEYTGGACVHVRNASLVTGTVMSSRPNHAYGSDELFVEGDQASCRMNNVFSSAGTTTPLLLHWGIDGSTTRDPSLLGMMALTTTYGGTTAQTWDAFAFKLDIAKAWSQRPRSDYIDLMSAYSAHKQSMINLAAKLNADPGVQEVLAKTGCRISYVTETTGPGSDAEKYRVRLSGGGRLGLIVIFR